MRVLTSCWFLPTVAAFSITALTGSLSKFISKTVPPEYLATATIDLHEKSSAAMNFLSHIQHFAHHYQNYLIGGLVAIAIFTPFAWVWWKVYGAHIELLEIEHLLLRDWQFITPNTAGHFLEKGTELMLAGDQDLGEIRVLVTNKSEPEEREKTKRSLYADYVSNYRKYQDKRRSARLNVLAYFLIVKGFMRAARDAVRTEQLKAIEEKKPLPVVLFAVARMLKLPLRPDPRDIIKEAEAPNESLGLLPWSMRLAIRKYKHPREMIRTIKIKHKDGAEELKKFLGENALESMYLS